MAKKPFTKSWNQTPTVANRGASIPGQVPRRPAPNPELHRYVENGGNQRQTFWLSTDRVGQQGPTSPALRTAERMFAMPKELQQRGLDRDRELRRPRAYAFDVIHNLGLTAPMESEWRQFLNDAIGDNEVAYRASVREKAQALPFGIRQLVQDRALSFYRTRRVVKSASSLDDLAKAFGGKYHRRVPDGDGGHRYYYDADKYERRGDAHVSGHEAAVNHLASKWQKAGYADAHQVERMKLHPRYGKDATQAALDKCGYVLKGGRYCTAEVHKAYEAACKQDGVEPYAKSLSGEMQTKAKLWAETLRRAARAIKRDIIDPPTPKMDAHWSAQDPFEKSESQPRIIGETSRYGRPIHANPTTEPTLKERAEKHGVALDELQSHNYGIRTKAYETLKTKESQAQANAYRFHDPMASVRKSMPDAGYTDLDHYVATTENPANAPDVPVDDIGLDPKNIGVNISTNGETISPVLQVALDRPEGLSNNASECIMEDIDKWLTKADGAGGDLIPGEPTLGAKAANGGDLAGKGKQDGEPATTQGAGIGSVPSPTDDDELANTDEDATGTKLQEGSFKMLKANPGIPIDRLGAVEMIQHQPGPLLIKSGYEGARDLDHARYLHAKAVRAHQEKLAKAEAELQAAADEPETIEKAVDEPIVENQFVIGRGEGWQVNDGEDQRIEKALSKTAPGRMVVGGHDIGLRPAKDEIIQHAVPALGFRAR